MATQELPEHLRARYGVGRRPWGLIALLVVVIGGFVAALAFVGVGLLAPKIDYKLLTWRDAAPDHVDVTFEVRRSEEQTVYCVVRAQDEQHVDVGYAIVPLAPGTTYVQTTYPLRTLAPAFAVDVLGCEAGGPPARVMPPQFPPGVVPPEQPWTPTP